MRIRNALASCVAAAAALLLFGCEEPGPPQTGSIRVTSAPSGARIFLDQSDTGRFTPYAIPEVSAGFHTIRLTLAGHSDWGPQSVSVAAGQIATVTATLEATEPPEPVIPPERGLGLELLDIQAYQNAHILRADPVAVPSSVDLSLDVPIPRSQGSQGSCVGWAVAFALKSYHERIERGWPLTGDRHLMSPAYVYNQIKVPGGGAFFLDAFNLLIDQGVSSWAQMPYDPLDDRTQPSAAARAEAANYRIAEWGVVLRTTHAIFVQEIKRHLATGAPVVIGVPVYPDFDSLSESNPVYDDAGGRRRGYHAIVIVGYDDALSAFRIINSWGADWGIGGYGWIDYAASKSLIRSAYVTSDMVASPDDERPVAASGPSPGNAVNGVAVGTVLSWTRNARTASFDVYLGTNRDLAAADFQGNVAQATFSPDLAPGSRYYWRIDARGAGGVTPGPVWSFTTAGRLQLPGKAIGPSPAHGATAVAKNTVLRWDSGGHTTSYDVYFGTNPRPAARQFQGTQATRTFSPGPLSTGTSYYWRIDAKNGQGTTTGDVWSFTTEREPELPRKAVNPNPTDGATGVTTDAVLRWNSGAHTTSYDVYFGTIPRPGAGQFQGTQATRTFSPGQMLTGTRYYWRIDAKNRQATTTGDLWTFVTDHGSDPGLSIADVSVHEGRTHLKRYNYFPVTLSRSSTQQVSVSYRTRDGTATSGPDPEQRVAGADYGATSGELTFSPGEISKDIRVATFGDDNVEQDEYFYVILSNPVNATLVDGSATGTIIDDDIVSPDRPGLSIADVSMSEGNIGFHYMWFPVRLSNPSTATVRISIKTYAGTATEGSDYRASHFSFVIAPGELQTEIGVLVYGDTEIELDETFTVNVEQVENAKVLDGTAIGTIINDDGSTAPVIPHIENRQYDVGVPITPWYLPPSIGGNLPISHNLAGLPPGVTNGLPEYGTNAPGCVALSVAACTDPWVGSWSYISGTPSTTGSYSVTYTVTDDDGDTNTNRFVIDVVE